MLLSVSPAQVPKALWCSRTLPSTSLAQLHYRTRSHQAGPAFHCCTLHNLSHHLPAQCWLWLACGTWPKRSTENFPKARGDRREGHKESDLPGSPGALLSATALAYRQWDYMHVKMQFCTAQGRHLPSNRDPRIQIVEFGGAQGDLLVLLPICSLNLQLHQLLLNPLHCFFLALHCPGVREEKIVNA